MKRLHVIVAVADNGVIGQNQRLPWHLPADLKHFKQATMGHPLIMGRKTHESIGHPLPGRRNIVITRNRDYRSGFDTVEITHSLDEALELCRPWSDETTLPFVIGGEQLFREALPHCHTLHLTLIHKTFEGDAYFPADVDVAALFVPVDVTTYTDQGDAGMRYSFVRALHRDILASELEQESRSPEFRP